MAKKIAWVTDSTASFTSDEKLWLEENDVYVVPLTVIFGEHTYREGIDITTEEFYKKMKTSSQSPKTSQPSLGDFINLYEKLKLSYDEAIVIHVSSKLSGTYSTSIQAASVVGFRIHSVDSWVGSFPLKFLVQTGIKLYKNGYSPVQLVHELNRLKEKCRLLILPSNLDQLRKSGRVSNFGSMLGNLLQIKPILGFNEGEVNIIQKVRTIKKAEISLLSHFQNSFEAGVHNRIALLYAGDYNATRRLLDKIKHSYADLKVEIIPLIPVAGVHTGVGTLGLAWIEE